MIQLICIIFGIIYIVKGMKGFRETGVMFGLVTPKRLTGREGRKAGGFMIAAGVALILFGLFVVPLLTLGL